MMLLESVGHAPRFFTSASPFLTDLADRLPDCVLLDVRMPDANGINVLRTLTQSHAGLPVIMITGHGDVPLAVKAMRLGAVDFIEKPFSDERIIQSVAEAIRIGREARLQLEEKMQARELVGTLTDRETQVLAQIVAGHPNKVIAYNLDISPRTIEVHRKRVMDKTGARSSSHVVRIGILAGIEPA
jgi:two-component system response regulator FixJ